MALDAGFSPRMTLNFIYCEDNRSHRITRQGTRHNYTFVQRAFKKTIAAADIAKYTMDV